MNIPVMENGSDRTRFLIILSFVIAGFLLKAYFTTLIPINQDEFHFLSYVHDYDRGTSMSAFQTIHVHLFNWLRMVGSNEVDQVMAARIAMFMLMFGTCACLFFLAQHFLERSAALFSVLCYISFSFVIVNGASFRPDTIAVFLSMLALSLFVIRGDSTWANISAGALLALSCLFTIKTAIYIALFIPLAFIRLHFSQYSIRSWKHFLGCSISFLAIFAIVYSLHASTLANAPIVTDHKSFPGNAFSTFFTFREIFPGREKFPAAFYTNIFLWLLLGSGFFLCVCDAIRRRRDLNSKVLYLVLMFIPLLSLLVYRNTHPYYFVFITPPLTLFGGYALHRLFLVDTQQKKQCILLGTATLALGVFLNFVLLDSALISKGRSIISHQRNVLAEIHSIFPKPVNYIDGCSMIASYPQVAFFMSTAGMKGYLHSGHPVFADILSNKKPILLLANVPHLNLRSDAPPLSSAGLAIIDKDWIALRSHFIHHWGQVWIVGKQFNAGSSKLYEHFDITVPGVYTLEANGDVVIDGRQIRSGDIVQLEQSRHSIEAKEATGIIRLRWGSHLYRPKTQPGSETLFMGIFG